MSSSPPSPTAAPATGERDRFIDLVRAGALLVVVFGHWMATLPQVQDATTIGNEHLLHEWGAAAWLTWVLQVVPLFVLVSAAATPTPQPGATLAWWSARAQRLARPTVTYLVVLAALWSLWLVGSPLGDFVPLFSGSVTVHLWFIVMLLLVQLALPLVSELDRRSGLVVPVALVVVAVAVDLARWLTAGGGSPRTLGTVVATAPAGIGWANVVIVWLVPQQLGLAWRRGRLAGRATGAGLVAGGLAWAAGCAALGYPVAMVGSDPVTGASNVLPPTAALLGVVAIQAGIVLLVEDPVRQWLRGRRRWQAVQLVAALGMPLYLWHKLAEPPALWVANRLGLAVDRGLPGDPGFWGGRVLWLLVCTVLVVPIVAAVVWWERRRRPRVPLADASWRLAGGGAAVVGATTWALAGGIGAAPFAGATMLAGSLLLRRRAPAADD